MSAIEAERVSYRYGGVVALDAVSLQVPEGSVYALLGPNGTGKTTLLQILSGLRRPQGGTARLFGRDVTRLMVEDRQKMSYMAESQPLPGWMRLDQLESYLAPLYPTWDGSLAAELRTRFRLDAARKLGTLSRGEHMKAALLCALAPRPRVVLMDEPFTGMDVVVRDEIAGGLLEAAGMEGWTIMLATHDISEVEMLADHVAILGRGRIRLSESLDSVRARFRRVDVFVEENGEVRASAEWLGVQRNGPRVSFLTGNGENAVAEADIRARCTGVVRIEMASASLRDVFTVTTRRLTSGQEQILLTGADRSAAAGNVS